MGNALGWNEIHDRLERLLPHGLDDATWEILQQQPLAFVADELLWRVEAIAGQVPPQGTVYLEPLTRTDRQHRGNCALCAEQLGSGVGQRCLRCVAALNLVLGFPLLLDDAGMIETHEKVALDQQDEPAASSLFEM